MGWLQIIILTIQVIREIIKLLSEKKIKTPDGRLRFAALKDQLKEARKSGNKDRLKKVLDRLVEFKDF